MKKRSKKQPAKQKFDTHLAMSPSDVDGVLKFFHLPLADFLGWMIGQTGPVLPNGELGTYHYDLKRYVSWKLGGPRPEFD